MEFEVSFDDPVGKECCNTPEMSLIMCSSGQRCGSDAFTGTGTGYWYCDTVLINIGTWSSSYTIQDAFTLT